MEAGNWPLGASIQHTSTGAASAAPGHPGLFSPVSPEATIPSGPSMTSSSITAPSGSAPLGRRPSALQQRASFSNQPPSSSTTTTTTSHPLRPRAIRSSSSNLNELARLSDNAITLRARMASEELDRAAMRDLAEFLKHEAPPRSNKMSRPDAFDYTTSTESLPSTVDSEPGLPHRESRRIAFPLLNPGKWGRLKSIKGRKRRKSDAKKRDGSGKFQIQLPDSAIAGTTIGGYRHIAISIPSEYCHLGPTGASQYPIYSSASLRDSLDRQQQTPRKVPRTYASDRGTVTVLNPVAEDRESVSSSSATRSPTNLLNSLDGVPPETTALRPGPQHDSYRASGVSTASRVQSMPAMIDQRTGGDAGADFSDAAGTHIHKPEVWIPRGAANRDSNNTNSDGNLLVSRVYIPRAGDLVTSPSPTSPITAKDGDAAAQVYVPKRQSSVKRPATATGSVAEALAILNGTGTSNDALSRTNSGGTMGGGRVSMGSIAASIATNLDGSEPGYIATAQVARRPSTAAGLELSTTVTTPLGTPLLLDFPSPPGANQIFVDLEHQPHDDDIPHETTEVGSSRKVAPTSPDLNADIAAGDATDSSMTLSTRKARVRERKQRDIEALRRRPTSQASQASTTTSSEITPPPPRSVSESPVLKHGPVTPPSTHPSQRSATRRTKSCLSFTPLHVIMDVEPSSPPRNAGRKSGERVRGEGARSRSRSSGHNEMVMLSLTPSVSSAGQSPPPSPPLPAQDARGSKLLRPCSSLPLDRTSLARRRELREVRDQLVHHNHLHGATQHPHQPQQEGGRVRGGRVVSGERSTSSSPSNPRPQTALTTSTAARGPRRLGSRGNIFHYHNSEFADSHDTLALLPRSELLGRYEALRDRHMRETERRLRRLEKNGDVWVRSIAPLLENLNRTLEGLRPGDLENSRRGDGHKGPSDDDDPSHGQEWRDFREFRRRGGGSLRIRTPVRARVSSGGRHYQAEQQRESDRSVSHGKQHHEKQAGGRRGSDSTDASDDVATEDGNDPPHLTRTPKGRVVGAAVEAIEGKSAVASPVGTPTKSRGTMVDSAPPPLPESLPAGILSSAVAAAASNAASSRQLSGTVAGGDVVDVDAAPAALGVRAPEDDTRSQASGMETLEPLMRELQGAARLSLESAVRPSMESGYDDQEVPITPLVEESDIFVDF